MYENMFIRPDAALPGKYIWDAYPDLVRRKVLSTINEDEFIEKMEEPPSEMDLHRLIIFCSLLCDTESPFYRERNIGVRIEGCMEAASIGKNERLAEIINDTNWWFQDVLSAFIALLNPTEFDTWLTSTMSAMQMKRYLRAPIWESEDIDKSMGMRERIQKALPSIDAQIKELEQKLFPDERIRKAVSLSITADGIGGWAERFALSKE